jgi:hypothetical protein
MKKTQESPDDDKKCEVHLSAPWGNSNIIRQQSINGTEDVTISFLRERTRIHELYIREQEKTRRIAMILAAILFISSLLVIVFAPKGREELSYWIGGTLLIFSAGSAGYKRLWAKGPLLTFEANDGKQK